MFTGFTRQEQRILLFLIGLITLGLGVHHFRRRPKTDVLFVEQESGEKQNISEGIIDKEASTIMPSPTQIPLININTAALEDLCILKGVGPVKARAVIEYREGSGMFRCVEDITNVPGIGPATLNRIRDQITVGDIAPREAPPVVPSQGAVSSDGSGGVLPTPSCSPDPKAKVNINTADIESLMTLENIGETKAKRIIEYRRRFGMYHTPEDLMKVRGIGKKTFTQNRHRIVVNH